MIFFFFSPATLVYFVVKLARATKHQIGLALGITFKPPYCKQWSWGCESSGSQKIVSHTLCLHKPRWSIHHSISNPIDLIISIFLGKLKSCHICHCLEQGGSRREPQLPPRKLLTNKRLVVSAESFEEHSLHARQEDRACIPCHIWRDLWFWVRCHTVRHLSSVLAGRHSTKSRDLVNGTHKISYLYVKYCISQSSQSAGFFNWSVDQFHLDTCTPHTVIHPYTTALIKPVGLLHEFIGSICACLSREEFNQRSRV